MHQESHWVLPTSLGNLGGQKDLNELEMLLKKGIRLVCNLGRLDHTGNMFKECRVLKMKDGIAMANVKICEQLINHTLPKNINKLFNIRNNVNLRMNITLQPLVSGRLVNALSRQFNSLPKPLRCLAASKGGILSQLITEKLSGYKDDCPGKNCNSCRAKLTLNH